MNSTAHRTQHTARHWRRLIDSASAQVDAYRRMVDAVREAAAGAPAGAAADTFADEIARLQRSLAEYDAEVDAMIEGALLDGYDFEDIEAVR